MADEAFALSPLSARASPPSEADYDAIRDAFMETTRGRWFLTQYAARNRNADTMSVLEAVARIEAGIAARVPETPSPADIVAAIRPSIAEARSAAEAAMHVPQTDEHVAAGRRGARIIREIAWSLRETGTDPRICNILDAQLLALEQLHEHVANDPRPALIGEVFDDLVLRIEDIAGTAAAARHRTPPARKPEPVETVGANADFAANVAPVVVAPVVAERVVAERILVEPPSAPKQPSADSAIVHAPTAREVAEDDAVLDLIATEMAVTETDILSDLDDEFDQVDSRIAELRSLAAYPEPMPAAAPRAPVAPQPSLGAALLAGGIVRPRRTGNDALAPFRRMTQVEKIAFFS